MEVTCERCWLVVGVLYCVVVAAGTVCVPVLGVVCSVLLVRVGCGVFGCGVAMKASSCCSVAAVLALSRGVLLGPCCECFLSVVVLLAVVGTASSLCLGVAPGGTWCKGFGVVGWDVVGVRWRGCGRGNSGVGPPRSAFGARLFVCVLSLPLGPWCERVLCVVIVLAVVGISSSLCLGVAPGGIRCGGVGVGGWGVLGWQCRRVAAPLWSRVSACHVLVLVRFVG